jgi:hypothetical protein
MTVEQFKQWLDGFTEALQLDIVSGFDADDLDDIFNKVKEKLAEVEQHVASTISTPLTKVPENLPHIPPTSPFGPHNPYPSRSPDVWYTHGTGVDRLNTWPGSSSTSGIKVESKEDSNPDRVVPRRG